MALKTTPWDSAEYLKTEEDRAQFLVAAIEEAPADSTFFAHCVGVVARSRNMSQLARDTGLAREGLYKALSEMGNPSFATVWKVLNAMGYQLTVVPLKKATIAKRKAAKSAAARPARAAAKRSPRAPSKTARTK